MVKLKHLLVTERCDFHTSQLSLTCSTIFNVVAEVKSIVSKIFLWVKVYFLG